MPFKSYIQIQQEKKCVHCENQDHILTEGYEQQHWYSMDAYLWLAISSLHMHYT